MGRVVQERVGRIRGKRRLEEQEARWKGYTEGARLVFAIASEAMWEHEENVRYFQVSLTVSVIVWKYVWRAAIHQFLA